ncbi:hypothetical protein [Streptomyces sp. NPDC058757]
MQCTRKTTDGEYDAGQVQKIGVITAYCHHHPDDKHPTGATM